MAKHRKQVISNGSAARPAPYKKPRVQVTYDGAHPPPSSKPLTPAPTTSSSKPTTTLVKGKGKAKAPTTTATSPPTATSVLPSSAYATPRPNAAQPTFLLVAGSYEKLLYGVEGSFAPGSASSSSSSSAAAGPTLKPTFIFPAHLACVKAIAASPGGKWLATGSEDEFVKVWDLRRRKEVGSLSQHTGSITSLCFPTSSHLITTSVDGTLALFRTSDWSVLKVLKGHSGRVNHVDVHPTGRVALTVGKDQTLKMWDLMRGRGAASLPLGTEAELVKFSPLGSHFAVLYPKKIEIYALTLKKLHTLETKSRFNSLAFALLPDQDEGEDVELLCVGTEKGVVEVWRVDVGEVKPEDDDDGSAKDAGEIGSSKVEQGGDGAKLTRVGTLVGHTNRIRAVSASPFDVPAASPDDKPRATVLLTTASSDGLINLYDLGKVGLLPPSDGAEIEEQKPAASYDTKGSRLTCVFLADGKAASAGMTANGNGKGGIKREEGGKKVEVKEEEMSDEDDDEEDDVDIYEGSDGDEGSDDEGMAVEFEDDEEEEEEEEDEEEEEEEGEYE